MPEQQQNRPQEQVEKKDALAQSPEDQARQQKAIEVKDKYGDDSFLEGKGKFDAYRKGLVPNNGKDYEEGGKIVYWNIANKGDTPEKVMAESTAGVEGVENKPLDAKYIDTPVGKKVIVKWERKKD